MCGTRTYRLLCQSDAKLALETANEEFGLRVDARCEELVDESDLLRLGL
jgi:hypothetical protein